MRHFCCKFESCSKSGTIIIPNNKTKPKLLSVELSYGCFPVSRFYFPLFRLEKPLQMQPEFIYPRNNTIEVELGK